MGQYNANYGFSLQNTSSNLLLLIVYVMISCYIVFSMLSILSVTQYIQLDVEKYLTAYMSVTSIIIMIWTITTIWFVSRFKPDIEARDEDKITKKEISNNNSVQLCAFTSAAFTGILGILLIKSMDDNLGNNDGYMIREGMDTSSSVYTLWLMILFSVMMTSCYIICRSPYIIDLYGNRFKKIFKPSLD